MFSIYSILNGVFYTKHTGSRNAFPHGRRKRYVIRAKGIRMRNDKNDVKIYCDTKIVVLKGKIKFNTGLLQLQYDVACLHDKSQVFNGMKFKLLNKCYVYR